jgi:predicted restriction endonuclease
LLSAYESKCAVTDCKITEVLEAAHIFPYLGPETNKIQNGILLRADIHTLFDLRLLSIDEEKFCILLSSILRNTEYANYDGKVINLPKNPMFYPDREALRKHREESSL